MRAWALWATCFAAAGFNTPVKAFTLCPRSTWGGSCAGSNGEARRRSLNEVLVRSSVGEEEGGGVELEKGEDEPQLQGNILWAKEEGTEIDLSLLEETKLFSNSSVKEGFKSGFVSIIGSPNVGKSTLMNSMVGDKLSIVTSKAQTTRHRIMGIVTSEDYQIVYSDTPGVLEPQYQLHEGMMNFVKDAIGDADVLLVLTDLFEKDFGSEEILGRIKRVEKPVIVAINKIDLLPDQEGSATKLSAQKLEEVGSLGEIVRRWQEMLPNAQVLPISAKEKAGTSELLSAVASHLEEGPLYFADDVVSDRPQRFFAAEIVREQVFTAFKQEIPYCSEIFLERFTEKPGSIAIAAEIIVARDSQKGIVIGKGGEKIKEVTETDLMTSLFMNDKVTSNCRIGAGCY
ncbi:unnamed protein product [Chrysoparadoxa australica]